MKIDYNERMESETKTLALNAYAKLNLTLDVLGKRPDGYHELCTVMACTSLCDRIWLTPAPGVTVESDLPLPKENSAYRAAARYLADYGVGARIQIQKRIPSEAGLGGASADAAAVLWGLHTLCGAPTAQAEAALFAMARDLGADVPFCLYAQQHGPGAIALCEGIGERITPLCADQRLPVLIVKGAAGVSTAALFGALSLPPPYRPNTPAVLAAIRAGDTAALTKLLCNALEPAAAAQRPEIARYKARLLEAGALGAAMSGSGASVFGLFAGQAQAQAAQGQFADAAFAFSGEI